MKNVHKDRNETRQVKCLIQKKKKSAPVKKEEKTKQAKKKVIEEKLHQIVPGSRK